MTHALSWTGLLIGAGVVVWGLFQLRVYLAVGAGYKAKVLCSALFGSGRELDPQHADQISADSYWLLRPFTARIDRNARTVTASLFGLHPRTAVHRDGLGATLLFNGQSPTGRSLPAMARTEPRHTWPATHGPQEVQRIVDAAFEEPNPRRRRRTYAVLAVQDGQIIAERYAPGITAGTPMPGWSVAKSVLGALVGVLVHEGRLSLDQRELLPHWRWPDPRAAIQLEDLLRMRSGLRFSENYGNPWSDVLHMLYNCHDAAEYAASLSLASDPGTVWAYSSGTTNILSNLVRRVVGEAAYHGWPRRVLFEPLGMTSAVMEADGSGTFISSSYMLATARDWARFGQCWMDKGRFAGREVLPADWIRFCTTPTPQSPDGRYGAHWWLKLNPEIGGDDPSAKTIAPDACFAVGHEGQALSIIPSKRLIVVRLGASIYVDAWNQAAFIAGIQNAV